MERREVAAHIEGMAHHNGWDEAQHPRAPHGAFTHKTHPEHPDVALVPADDAAPAVEAEALDAALEAAKTDWFRIRDRFADTIQASIPHRVRALFPDATGLDLEGEYNDDGYPTLRIHGVYGPDGALIANVDHDQDRSDNDGDLVDKLAESDLADDLQWLPEIHDDWTSSDPIRVDFADLAGVIARVHPPGSSEASSDSLCSYCGDHPGHLPSPCTGDTEDGPCLCGLQGEEVWSARG